MIVAPADVIQLVARFYKVSPNEILSADRTQRVCRARYAAIYLCRRTVQNATHRRLGAWFNRNQATIDYALGQVVERRQRAPRFDARLRGLEAELAKIQAPEPKETAHVR